MLSLVGDTPLIPLVFGDLGLTVYAKCEFLNPSGSIKDRFARMVLLDARQRGVLQSDSIIVECSSGKTGIALAMTGTALGYQVTILMSEAASVERRQLIRQLGANIIPLPEGEGWGEGEPGRSTHRRPVFRHLTNTAGATPGFRRHFSDCT